MKVLNFGSLNIDYVYSLDHFVQKGETISSDALNIFPGGKGLNQSLALGRAGVATIHAGAVGKDGEFSEKILCCTKHYLSAIVGKQFAVGFTYHAKGNRVGT